MPPLRIRAGGDQADDGCPLSCAFMGLAEPLTQDEAVRRIAPANAFPALPERICSRRNEPLALRVVGQRGHVEREMKLGIERREQIRGRLPFIRAVPECDRLALAFALPVRGLLLGVRTVDFRARQGTRIVTKKRYDMALLCRKKTGGALLSCPARDFLLLRQSWRVYDAVSRHGG
jgi:hypothetical protein